MSWEAELAELRHRRAAALEMGGPEGIARQRKRGKLTVRERIAALADDDSFEEFNSLTGDSVYDDEGRLVEFTPSAEVEGMCDLDGRRVVIAASDFTVRGGSGTAEHGALGLELSATQRALQWRLPLVRLLDTAGGSVKGFEGLGRTYLPDGGIFTKVDTDLLGVAPVVAAVLGSVAGLPAVDVCMSHFSVMVEGISHVFPGGPPVVKAAFGYDISKEDLGGPQVHTRESGVVDNLATDELDAFDQIRLFLSYLPSSVDEMAPRSVPAIAPADTASRLRDLVPRDPRQPFDARQLVKLVVDEDSFFEIAAGYGQGRVVGLARVDGYPVGVMANNPAFAGGATGVAEGDKVIRLIRLCDSFHLPLVSFVDEPGFMVGLEAERRGIERAGARLICATNDSRMPWITFVISRVFGVAGACQHRPSGMYARYCWPSGRWGSMHIQGGAAAAYKTEIEAADDPVAKLAEIEQRLDALASPFRTAEATGQDIIDPAETRRYLVRFVHDAQRVLAIQLGPSPFPYRP